MASNRSKRILLSVLDANTDNIPRKKSRYIEEQDGNNSNHNDFCKGRGTSESPIPKDFEDELVQLQELLGDVFNDENEYNCHTLIDEGYNIHPVPDKQTIYPVCLTSLAKSEKQDLNSGSGDGLTKESGVTQICQKSSEIDISTPKLTRSNPETTEIFLTASPSLETPEKEVIISDCSPSIILNSSSYAINVEGRKDLDASLQILPEKSLEIDNCNNNTYRTAEIDSAITELDTPIPSPMHSSDDNCSSQYCPYCSSLQAEAAYTESEPPTPSTVTSIGSPFTPLTIKQRKKTFKTDKGKKRKAHKESWQVTQRKKLKNAGKSFTNSKGKLIEDKVLKQPCNKKCRLKCSDVLDERQRLKIFYKFWSLGERSLQWRYVIKYTERVEKGRKTTTETKHNRRYTYIYYLPTDGKKRVKVCKTMFLNTISSGERIISTAWKKDTGYNIVEPDRRGKYDHKKTVIDEEMVKSVCDHVNSFPLVESHRIRKDSTKLYLEGIDSISRMYKLYCEWEDLNKYTNKARTKRQYRDIVNENKNIAIHRPKKDICDICHSFSNRNNPTEAQIKKQERHLASKETARKLKSQDKQEALQNKKLVVAVFDFQKVLTTPHGEVSVLYYKRKLPTLNFTVYNVEDKSAKCYMWHEGIAKRGANEVSSCLYSFIKEHAEKGVEEFRFWSDNCSGQNRNRIVFTLYMLAAKEFNVTITHRFLEKGHTQNEGDSVHSVIERAGARKMIYVPEEWYCLVRWAKSEGDPYIVHEIQSNDIYNVKELLKNKNWEKNILNERMQWKKIREIKVNKEQYDRLEYKYEFSQPSKTIVVLRCAGRTNTQRFLREFQLVNAYNGPLLISYDKHKDLIDMCNAGIIPEKYHNFYNDLPHLEKAPKKKDNNDPSKKTKTSKKKSVSKKKNVSKKKTSNVETETDTDTDNISERE